MPRGASVSRTSSAKPTAFVRNVVPDRLDLRDRPYRPAITITLGPAREPRHKKLPILNQGGCNGCTGFALASVIHQFYLTDDAEQKDTSCNPILGYSRSQIYLVSQSFKQGKTTPKLGMSKYFDAKLKALPNVRARVAPCKESQSVEHGGFDDDKATRERVVALVKGRGLAK